MRFPPDFLDELRTRLPVSEVVGRRVALKKAGNEWRGLSPFNQEKTPSFYVNDQKGFFHDFSAGEHGDIFGFVMKTEGVTFIEAVEQLASMAGMPVPKVSREEEVRAQRRRTLHEVLDLAAKFFAATLASRVGAKARGYLADRALEPATQVKFGLGYAPPERFALKEHLGKEGVPVEDMIEAGLLVSGDEIPVPYDRFRDRVMFPIADLRNRVIAFGGRALASDAQAKYLNSPETQLFHKGATLYNLSGARLASHRGAPVIAVEGYVDVIAMVTAGFEGCVAPLGTALTPEQMQLLWKMTDEPILCFDGDGAGRRAAYRAVDTALPLLRPGKSLRFASLPEGQDPDDSARSGGRAAIDEVLAGALPLSQVAWTRETEGGSLETPERRAALEGKVAEITGRISDEAVRRHYRADFENRLAALFVRSAPASARRAAPPGQRWSSQPPRTAGPRGRFTPRPPADPFGHGIPYIVTSPQLAASAVHRGPRTAVPRREALILRMVLNHPWLLHDHLEELSELEFRHVEAGRIKAALIDIAAHDGAADPEQLARELAGRGFTDLVARLMRSITTESVWGAQPEAAPDDVLMTWKQLVALGQWHSLIKELRDAELALGRDANEANYSWLQGVKARLSGLDGTEALIEGFGTF